MTCDAENLILGRLRAMRASLAAIKDDMREMKSRLTALEASVTALRRDQVP